MSCERPVPGSDRSPALARIRIGAAFGLAMILATAPLAAELPTVELAIKRHRVIAEVAATDAARTTGLMNRFSLQPDHGMLFVFKQPQPQAFWMKDTYVPLSIAFIGSDGKILNIEDMAPLTESTHPSRGAALYALEMKKGWFVERGIGAGDGVAGLEKAPKARE
jgi:uncharacterized membrane protein (UPF0127 family)